KNQATLNRIRYVIDAFHLAVQSAYDDADLSSHTDDKTNN
ncbi:unnamed protein product, partial [Rotaria sordida]